MKNNTKQVVILDNFSSPYVYQAILILKDYNPALEDKVIAEAEKIVSDYLNKPLICTKKENSKFIPLLISLFVISAVAASIFLFF